MRWVIDFSTRETCKSYITYWRTGYPEEKFSGISEDRIGHNIEIVNLLPNEEYSYKLHAKSGDKIFVSEVFNFKTDSLPDVVPDYTLTIKDHDFNGYILLKKFADLGCFVLLDDSAHVVWYEPYDTTILRPFQWTQDRTIVSLLDSTTIVEFDLHGKILNRLDIRECGIENRIHHELFKNALGQYVFLNYDYKFLDLSSQGGQKNDTVRTDGIMVIDSTGYLLWEWSVFDVLDPLTDANIMDCKQDWGHANSISYADDNNYLLSFRDFNQVWKVDSNNGSIMWRFGENGDFKIELVNLTIKQHTAHLNSNGELMVFDNGNAERGNSRIISYKMDEESMIAESNINFMLDKSMTTFRMGSGYMIGENHVLVCSPKKRLGLAIYDIDGKVRWKVSGSYDSYRAIYIDTSEIENKQPF